MARHLFRKVGDGPWKDVGVELLEKLIGAVLANGGVMTEENVVADVTELANLRIGPVIAFEVRDVPDNMEETPSISSR